VRSRVAAELIALVVPPACASCGSPVEVDGGALCAPCHAALPWLGDAICRRCALPLPCSTCPARVAAFERAWAPLAHRGPARALVAALKFRRALAVAPTMALHMAMRWPDELMEGATLVPGPRHPARRRRRGFDQAEVLADALGSRTGIPVRRCLTRSGAAARQVGARRAVRLTRERISVRVTGRAPELAVLVDDVHTTGATLDACARALLLGGADGVAAVTYTRTLPG
jgi:predicted amidophosphoribosyltransferase